ncbi:MAG: hypothetical protein D6812_03615 [Deltaproteobacteria bacterium]|nr:MAG: hypothetical protein D6812_03615 [Deltaproteobacteria bacterium]
MILRLSTLLFVFLLLVPSASRPARGEAPTRCNDARQGGEERASSPRGKRVRFSAASIVGGERFLPLAEGIAALGGRIVQEPLSGRIIVAFGADRLALAPESRYLVRLCDGSVTQMDAVPFYEGGRLLVPASFFTGILARRLALPIEIEITGAVPAEGRVPPPPTRPAPQGPATSIPSASPLTIVLDAGHGGEDAGAVGTNGLLEKDLVLALVFKLKAELERIGGIEVVLTRRDDTFLPLPARTRIANRADGTLFLSIHANASVNRKASGFETYILATRTSDRESERLAEQENAGTTLGETGYATLSDLERILADLSQEERSISSTLLAEEIEKAASVFLPSRGARRLPGIRQAPFYVLVGARMPAALIEVGYLSHPQEAKRLASPAYQERIVRAIAQGVRRYLTRRYRFPTTR